MKNKTEEKKQELLPKTKNEQAEIVAFMPIAEKWVENQSEQAQLNHEINKEQLSVISNSNKRNYNLLVIIVIGIFLMASGIIFYLKNLEAGLLVLSHVGAVVAGLLAGLGIQKSRTRE